MLFVNQCLQIFILTFKRLVLLLEFYHIQVCDDFTDVSIMDPDVDMNQSFLEYAEEHS